MSTITPINELSTVPQVEQKPQIQIERVGGKDRIETSLKIAEKLDSKKAYVVSADTFADAISVGPIASKNGAAIVLSRNNRNLGKELSGMGVASAIVKKLDDKRQNSARQNKFRYDKT